MPRLPWSTQISNVIIFLLVFLNLGVIYNASTNAASYSVQMAYFCAADQCTVAPNLPDRAVAIQSWYGQRVGKTFVLKDTNQGSSKSQLTIKSNLTVAQINSLSEWNQYLHLRDTLTSKGILTTTNKVAVEVGFPMLAANHCGMGKGQLALTVPAKAGCSGRDSEYLAHELGHILGLEHISDGSLMDGTACPNKTLSTCPLNATQKNQLLSSPYLVTQLGAAAVK